MTIRQERFCWAYVSTAFAVGALAARQAGYRHRWARCQASRLLRRHDVQAFLKHIRGLTSHPRCLACGQPLMDSGHSLRFPDEFRNLEPILQSWNQAMQWMSTNSADL
jgi:hypothetical protein